MNTEETNYQPTNSERLYMILAALTGDSDPANWNINGVATLAALVKKIGLKNTDDDSVDEAASTAIYQANRMIEKLQMALAGLPEYLPRLRRRDEIAKLKENWIASGRGWNIEATTGFEAHTEDLRTYSLQTELAMLHAGGNSFRPGFDADSDSSRQMAA